MFNSPERDVLVKDISLSKPLRDWVKLNDHNSDYYYFLLHVCIINQTYFYWN